MISKARLLKLPTMDSILSHSSLTQPAPEPCEEVAINVSYLFGLPTDPPKDSPGDSQKRVKGSQQGPASSHASTALPLSHPSHPKTRSDISLGLIGDNLSAF